MAAVPRVASSHIPGGKGTNLPIIRHPMSKLGNKNDLAIRGSSSSGFRQNNGHIFGGAPLGVGSASTRGVDAVRKSAPERMIHWPPGKPIILL